MLLIRLGLILAVWITRMSEGEVMVIRATRPDGPPMPPPPPKASLMKPAPDAAAAAVMQQIRAGGMRLRKVGAGPAAAEAPKDHMDELLQDVARIQRDEALPKIKKATLLRLAQTRVAVWKAYLDEQQRLGSRRDLPEAIYKQLQEFCRGRAQVFRDDDSDRDAELLAIARVLGEHENIQSFEDYRRTMPVRCHDDKAALEAYMRREADREKAVERDKQLREWDRVKQDQWSFIGQHVLERIKQYKQTPWYQQAKTPQERAQAGQRVLRLVDSTLVTPLWSKTFGATGISRPPLWTQLLETGAWQQGDDAKKRIDLNELLPDWNLVVPVESLEQAQQRLEELQRENANLKQLLAEGGGQQVPAADVSDQVVKLQAELERLRAVGVDESQLAPLRRELQDSRALLRDVNQLARKALKSLRM